RPISPTHICGSCSGAGCAMAGAVLIRTNSFESGWLVTDVGNLVDRGEAKAVRTILAPALAVTQSLPSGHSFLKTRLLATIAAHYGAIGDQETAVDLLTQARQAEVNIQGAEFKAKALTAIAEGYKAAEASAIAAEISTLALQQAELVEYPNPVRRAWVVQPIAVVFAQAGDLKQALAIAQSIEDANYRDRTVSDIALASAQAGQADRALELLQTVTFAEPKAETLAAIGSQLANEGSEEPARLFFEQALEAAGSEAYLQLRVAQALMQVGFLEDADAALSALPEGEFKAKGLMELVRLQAEAGEPETASEWLLQAVEATAAVEEGYRREELLEAVYGQAIALEAYDVAVATIQGRSDPEVFVTFDETVAYRDLASAAAQAGHFEVALEAVEAIDPSFYDPINQAWLAIARAHATAGDFEAAIAVAEKITPPNVAYRPQALAVIGLQDQQAGIAEDSAAMMAQAIQEADALEIRSRVAALNEIALEHAKAGQTDAASELLDRVLAIATESPTASDNDLIVQNVVHPWREVGEYAFALRAIQTIEDSQRRESLLRSLIDQLVFEEQYPLALESIAAASSTATQTHQMLRIAEGYFQSGQPDEALPVLDRAFEVAQTVAGEEARLIEAKDGVFTDDALDRASLYEEIAVAYGKAGAFDQGLVVAQSLQDAQNREQAIARLNCYRDRF
ncbi:MAG: hypothetical protein AAFQ89_15135, partial [Cyanobacteria bacterium J06626_18]